MLSNQYSHDSLKTDPETSLPLVDKSGQKKLQVRAYYAATLAMSGRSSRTKTPRFSRSVTDLQQKRLLSGYFTIMKWSQAWQVHPLPQNPNCSPCGCKRIWDEVTRFRPGTSEDVLLCLNTSIESLTRNRAKLGCANEILACLGEQLDNFNSLLPSMFLL